MKNVYFGDKIKISRFSLKRTCWKWPVVKNGQILTSTHNIFVVYKSYWSRLILWYVFKRFEIWVYNWEIQLNIQFKGRDLCGFSRIYEIKHLGKIEFNERVGIRENKLNRTSESVSFLSFKNFLHNFLERCCTLLVTASLLGLNLSLYKTVLIKRKQTDRKLHFSIVFENEPVPLYFHAFIDSS